MLTKKSRIYFVGSSSWKDVAEKQKLFDLLDYAYIGARYDAGYRIERDEFEYLSEKVQTLLKMTEEMCR